MTLIEDRDSRGRTVLGACDLGQNPEGSGLGGAGTGTPVLRVLCDALPAGVSMSGHMVKVDVCVHNVSPGNSGRTRERLFIGCCTESAS